MNKNEKKVVLILAIVAFLTVASAMIFSYANDFYEATQKADESMLGNELVEVIKADEYYLFQLREEQAENKQQNESEVSDTQIQAQQMGQNTQKKGIIFYPGGKVEETAYAPILLQFAEAGYEVYLVKMPIKLAIFGVNRAENIIEQADDITEWTMMGHSLGGAMAASFSAEHDEQVDNLVLLSAYSTKDLSDKEIEVYSFYGSEDMVLNMEKYQKYYTNLPEDTIEEVIDGGNHSYYAHYGEQKGDGEATISRKEQQECVLDVFLQYEIRNEV